MEYNDSELGQVNHLFFIGLQPVANADTSNELMIHYLFQHRDASLIGDAPTFSLEVRYRSIVHIGVIQIRLTAKSGCRKDQLAVAHAALLSFDGLDHSGRSAMSLVH